MINVSDPFLERPEFQRSCPACGTYPRGLNRPGNNLPIRHVLAPRRSPPDWPLDHHAWQRMRVLRGTPRTQPLPKSLRLSRLMCGRPSAFRQAATCFLGLCPIFIGAEPRIHYEPERKRRALPHIRRHSRVKHRTQASALPQWLGASPPREDQNHPASEPELPRTERARRETLADSRQRR
jgi:hypothetical protein